MKKFLTVMAVLLAFLVSETFAKSRSSGFSRSSSKSSFSKSSYKSSKSSYKTTKPKSTSSWGKKSTVKSNTSTVKPKAVSTNKLDAKQTKKVTSNKSTKRFSSKKEAETAARKSLIQKNSYTSSKPPTKRPEYVPSTVSRNGRSYDVKYYPMPGGGYGYGYRDPTSGLIVSLLAADMIMDAAMMNRYGYSYGPAPVRTTHVVHKGESKPMSSMGWVFTFMVTLFIMGLIIFFIRKGLE